MKKQANNKLLLAVLAQSVFLASMGTSMANLALPAICTEFGIEFASARLVVLSYLLSITVFSLIVGRFADLKGRYFVLLGGTALFVASTVLGVFAPAFWVLVIARVLQGVGAAALFVLPIVIATETVSSSKTGRSIGLLATMSAVGTASGPSVGGIALALYGWRSVFLVMAILGAMNLILLLKVSGIEKAKARLSDREQGLFKVIGSIFLNSELRLRLLFNLAVSAVMMATLVVGPYYLSKGLRLSPFLIGLIMSSGPVTSIVSGFFSGIAVDRFGARTIVATGFVQLLIGSVSFALLPQEFGAAGFAVSAVLLSLGYQLFLSANSNRIMKCVATESRGLASGGLSKNIGLLVGTSAFGAVFDLFANSPAGVASGLKAVFAAATLLILASFIIFIVSEQRSKNETRFPFQIHSGN
jgi:MFS family permease